VDTRLLRKLSCRVTPGSLRLGLKEPRRRTFLVGVGRAGNRLVLRLDPIPRCPSTGRAVFDFTEGDRQFWVAGAIAPVEGTAARIRSHGAPAAAGETGSTVGRRLRAVRFRRREAVPASP
jgi:hypothetical protein